MKAFRSGAGVFDSTPDHAYYASLRPEMAALLPTQAMTILDVGCGAGVFAASLKQSTATREVWGIEINPKVGAEAAKVLDKVLVGDITDVVEQLPLQYFDAIYFNDVLEHLVDPYSLLSKVKQHIKPGGLILASLPNVRYIRNFFHFIAKKDWAYTDHGVLDRTHLRFFTLKSAKAMFESLGFTIESIRGIEPTRKWYMPVLNLIFLGYFSDTLYLQFVFKIKIRDDVRY